MPDASDKISFEHKGIGDVIAHNRLVVPLNQREYSWEDRHVVALLEDFSKAIVEPNQTHFLGTIVLTRGAGNVPEVSDGQQRLATTTILLAALRDYFFRNDDLKRANYIESQFLLTTDIYTTEDTPKLRLNVDDNVFFTNYVLSPPDSPDRKIEPTKDSHKRIINAAKLASLHLQKTVAPFNEKDRANRLLAWLQFLSVGAQVILLRVPDHLDAFLMFETLNDRGLRASQADLLKNHLLSYAKDRISEAQQKWAKMIGVLESLEYADITVTYLHHLLITKFGPTIEREVFVKVKSHVNSHPRSMEFLNELAEGANDYAALFSSDHAKWNEYGTSTRKNISTINRELKVEQIRPLMFAISRHFSVKEAQQAFRLLVFWSVRILIGGLRGGVPDRHYALTAQAIGEGRITTAKELTKAMAEIVPNDTLFEDAFVKARVSQVRLARYYLRAMEAKQRGVPEPEWVPSEDEQIINLEHILPEHPQSNWPDLDPEAATANYKRIGNMVILQAKKNSIIGNKSFAEKRDVLKNSNYALTAEVAEYDQWGIEEIEDRQKSLAQLAVKTWPVQI